MDISVILPTYNNSKMLVRTLLAFENINFPKNSELIVVNNNSNDNTEDTIRSFSERLPIVYVFEPKQGTSVAKNKGIKIKIVRIGKLGKDDLDSSSMILRKIIETF